jgi:hypothetical protein
MSAMPTLPNIQQVHGLVSDYAYWAAQDLTREEIRQRVETSKSELMNKHNVIDAIPLRVC